ncbi:unnamed protein product [Ixodes persulcatus]
MKGRAVLRTLRLDVAKTFARDVLWTSRDDVPRMSAQDLPQTCAPEVLRTSDTRPRQRAFPSRVCDWQVPDAVGCISVGGTLPPLFHASRTHFQQKINDAAFRSKVATDRKESQGITSCPKTLTSSRCKSTGNKKRASECAAEKTATGVLLPTRRSSHPVTHSAKSDTRAFIK